MPGKAARKTNTPAKKAPYDTKTKGEKKAGSKLEAKKAVHKNLFESKAKIHRIGHNVQPKRDLTRFVRWPGYVKIQRQRAILMKRLKTPPSINQFTHTLGKNNISQLFRLLKKYQPETSSQKRARLLKTAAKKVKGAAKTEAKPKKPNVVKYGLNHVTSLIEQKKASLVVIAHDVNPIELVVWLPALCRRRDVPYCIVKGKARLGQIVHKKTAAVLAFTTVNAEDNGELNQLASTVRSLYNANTDTRRQWGGGILGQKALARNAKKARVLAKQEKGLNKQQ